MDALCDCHSAGFSEMLYQWFVRWNAVSSRSVSDFGTGLQSYIGRSNYDDPLYQGDFKDFRVYKNALNEEQIMQVAGIKEEQHKPLGKFWKR